VLRFRIAYYFHAFAVGIVLFGIAAELANRTILWLQGADLGAVFTPAIISLALIGFLLALLNAAYAAYYSRRYFETKGDVK